MQKKMSKKVFYGIIGLAIFVVGLIVGGIMQIEHQRTQETPEPIQQVDYSDRFDRLERGIENSTRDICFQWGGQWLTDGNNLATQDFDIPLQDGLFARGQAIMCIKQKQEVQQ